MCFPCMLFGETDRKGHNVRMLQKHIDQFLRARHFESLSLGSVMDGIKVTLKTCISIPIK